VAIPTKEAPVDRTGAEGIIAQFTYVILTRSQARFPTIMIDAFVRSADTGATRSEWRLTAHTDGFLWPQHCSLTALVRSFMGVVRMAVIG